MLQFIECEPGIAQELSDRLTFEVPGAKYMPAVRKKGGWDGHIRLFNRKNGQINAGLYDNIRSYIESSGHTIELEETEFGVPGSKNGVQRKEVVDWINTLTLPWEPYYYQIDAVTHALRHKRAVFVCPTGSGKSYIAYLASRAYLARHQSHILIIVPTTSLVEQLSSDFIEYNASMSDYVQKIYQGHEIEIKKPIVISTWQSIYKLPKKYFESGDPYFCECHKTARMVAEELALEDSLWSVAFQSRFGPMEWLQPYTDVVLEDWARNGITNVNIICPGFSGDCLETLEEIQIQYRTRYLNAGGKKFTYIPALNDSKNH